MGNTDVKRGDADASSTCMRPDPSRLLRMLPPLEANAYKYSRGVLSAVVGSSRYPGAAVLASRAAARIGTGYTKVFCAPEAADLVRSAQPSLVVEAWDAPGVAGAVSSSAHAHAAVLLGSGFDADDDACTRTALCVLRNVALPIVIDGGAFATLASAEGRMLVGRLEAAVITPHAGEAERLARAARIPWRPDRPDTMAARLAQAYNAVCVLKGSDTYISDGSRCVLMDFGTVALAKAGTGDVLAGMIAGLAAQGASPFDASVLGASLHALAGSEASARLSIRSVIAEDLIDSIPAALKELGER